MTARSRHLTGVGSPPPTVNSHDMLVVALLFLPFIFAVVIAVCHFCWIRCLSPNSNKALPKMTLGEEEVARRSEKLADCAICLAAFVAGEEIRVLSQCEHAFHVACIDTWLGSHPTCPCCRAIVVVASCIKKCVTLPAAEGP